MSEGELLFSFDEETPAKHNIWSSSVALGQWTPLSGTPQSWAEIVSCAKRISRGSVKSAMADRVLEITVKGSKSRIKVCLDIQGWTRLHAQAHGSQDAGLILWVEEATTTQQESTVTDFLAPLSTLESRSVVFSSYLQAIVYSAAASLLPESCDISQTIEILRNGGLDLETLEETGLPPFLPVSFTISAAWGSVYGGTAHLFAVFSGGSEDGSPIASSQESDEDERDDSMTFDDLMVFGSASVDSEQDWEARSKQIIDLEALKARLGDVLVSAEIRSPGAFCSVCVQLDLSKVRPQPKRQHETLTFTSSHAGS
eukprot:394299-Rhodomonas_salina.3